MVQILSCPALQASLFRGTDPGPSTGYVIDFHQLAGIAQTTEPLGDAANTGKGLIEKRLVAAKLEMKRTHRFDPIDLDPGQAIYEPRLFGHDFWNRGELSF
ncbi:hypothetical protein Ga0080559_TMP1856 [Salipiger profundus]|uniref:Uncharacterized protein n=1 Tax=Salipiger profundus TaxID=1229727 RepID=A0A1U7D3F3_9RHOB|nr:hypothetical protein Ga0080559_TMP1856 [Salipiger profundus]